MNGSFVEIPRLSRVPWLAHGFGTAEFSENDLRSLGDSQGFRAVILNQTHSASIHKVDAMPAKKLSGDGLMTAVAGLALVIKTADCLPAFLVDETHKAVAAVHCGWKGTQKRILERAVREMAAAYGSEPGSLVVGLGPCIGPECYEVGRDVRDGFVQAGFPEAVFWQSPTSADKFLLNLRQANIWLLEAAGIGRGSIFSVDACTRCRPELLSFRRDHDSTKRMFSFVVIRARS
jgi:polyphenol oxidase